MESRFEPKKYYGSNGRHPGGDRLSSLPDELLLIILSFLTVKELVKTSIFSSRWFNLWINSPVLDFQLPFPCDASGQMECKNYVKSVNLVLRRHKSPFLKIFKTAFHLKPGYQTDIDGWLEFALARKVEILELHFVYSDCHPSGSCNYSFPDRCLRFDLLTSLKSLSLRNVDVAGEVINFILLNCPFLERLVLVENPKLVDLVISCPTLVLKHLIIKRCFYFKVLRISSSNLVSLDACSQDLILSDLSMLVELSLTGRYYHQLTQLFSRVASYFPQLVALTLNSLKLEELTPLPNLAQLKKLKRLVINVKGFRCEDTSMRLTALLSFMKSCRKLEEVVLALTWYNPNWSKRIMCGVESFDISTSSLSSSLKVFELKGYFGRASDFNLIIHVVKNAPNLEKIIIKAHDLILRSKNRPEDIIEKEARNFAMKQIGALRESAFIPPLVDVIIC